MSNEKPKSKDEELIEQFGLVLTDMCNGKCYDQNVVNKFGEISKSVFNSNMDVRKICAEKIAIEEQRLEELCESLPSPVKGWQEIIGAIPQRLTNG